MSVRKINVGEIKQTVKALLLKANIELRSDVLQALEELYRKEEGGTQAKNMLGILVENANIAREKRIPICQDTGLAVVFLNIGGNVVLDGGDIKAAVNEGVEEAYKEGSFRNSVVEDPITRKNTGTNAPASIHIDIVEGDNIEISVMPKGFGSENKSRLIMMNPTADSEKIVDFCVETVKIAGPDACPPYVLGVGIGGTMESCALLAKKALFRPINESNPKPHLAELEKKIKEKCNALGIGVMGLGGGSTVMGVGVEAGPTHIAGLPVAVNVGCHALRSASTIL
ncbi:MAG: fumarate hydratase [Candidatus Omnitrophota bacterium]